MRNAVSTANVTALAPFSKTYISRQTSSFLSISFFFTRTRNLPDAK